MIHIKVSDEIKHACPDFAGAAIYAKVKNTPYSEDLWKTINEFTIEYQRKYTRNYRIVLFECNLRKNPHTS